MAIAMFQPVTRGDISEMFGREISRDLIAALREEGLIAAGPRSPKLGAPYAFVTTEKFLFEFGLEFAARSAGLRNKLEDAGLLGRGAGGAQRDERRLALERDGPALPTSQAHLGLGLRAEDDDPEEDAA